MTWTNTVGQSLFLTSSKLLMSWRRLDSLAREREGENNFFASLSRFLEKS